MSLRLPACEIDRNAPLTAWERAALGILAFWPLLAILAIGAVCGGCKAFYENAGSHTRVGSLTAPVEVSEPSDSITVRALYSMDGADVYTAKDSLVKIRYRNAYTNDYFAIVKTRGVQDLEVEIEPLATDAASETNAVDSTSITN